MIRQAEQQDTAEILRIYAAARAFMRRTGNMTQWTGGYPSAEIVRTDIEKRTCWVLTDETGRMYAVFSLILGSDPTYAHIDGAWQDPSPYATIHRAGSDGTQRGVFRTILDFARARYTHLRADTHADNTPMQNCLQKSGFIYCGIIYIADGTPRRAYEWSSRL